MLANRFFKKLLQNRETYKEWNSENGTFLIILLLVRIRTTSRVLVCAKAGFAKNANEADKIRYALTAVDKDFCTKIKRNVLAIHVEIIKNCSNIANQPL